jgi:TatD DNase family protein
MTTLRLIDAHCHLDFTEFDDDREAVLLRAGDQHITDFIIPGTKREYWPRIDQLCAKHRNCHACYGLHPYWSASHTDADIEALRSFIETHAAVAVGECGLDFRSDHIPDDAARQRQLAQFEAQLGIAVELELPVVIHAVKSTQQVIDMLKHFPGIRGMMHSYSGSLEQARQLIDMGLYISIGSIVSYQRANKLRKVAGRIPLQAMLLETDAPDQPGSDHQGERNEPAYLGDTVRSIAQLRDESVAMIAAQTTANACTLFGID